MDFSNFSCQKGCALPPADNHVLRKLSLNRHTRANHEV
jgi:hypothetical protein